MNCPACGYYNPTGSTSCFHCSLQLPVAAAIDALCARHPEVKATGACSRCGTFGCGQCLQQNGMDWLCASCLERAGVLPWDERATIGMWRAWWRTAVLMISQPTKTTATANPDAPIGSSITFATLSTIAGMGPTILVYALIMIPMFLFAPNKDMPKFSAALIPVFVIFYIAFLLAMQVASVFVVAGIDHLGLMLVGANPKSYSVTIRAYSLSMGCYLVGLVPICGLYVFPIWSLVLRIITNMQLHKTSGGKAAAAVLLPMVVLCGGFGTLYIALIALATSSTR